MNLTYPKMKNGARSVKACLYQNLTASNTVRLAANRYGAGKPPRVCERCDAKTIHKGLGISQQAKIPVLHFCKAGIFYGKWVPLSYACSVSFGGSPDFSLFGTERNGKDIIPLIDQSLIAILVFIISIIIS